jgi:hypothetical protein
VSPKPASTRPGKRSLTPQEASGGQNGSRDPVLSLMRNVNIPITRENYLNLAYTGDVPSPLSAEEKADLPPENPLDLASKPLSTPHTKNLFQTGPEKAR